MDDTKNIMEYTADIVAGFVGKNTIGPDALPDLIRSVYMGLANMGSEPVAAVPETAKAKAGQIRKSITPDGLISFVDGKTYKMLKRHLTRHGLTFDTYREQFGLPKDYPTVAPNYSVARSEMAKASGLGAKGRGSAKAARAKTRAPRAKV